MNRYAPWLAVLLLAVGADAKPRLVPVSDLTVIIGQSSNPSSLTRAGSQVFFIANDGIHGSELWRSDGTASGTTLVMDMTPGQASSELRILGALGNAVLFQVNSWDQSELWRSDGTAAGTWRLFRPVAAPPTFSFNVYPADNRVFIATIASFGQPNELWVSDGFPDDARRVGGHIRIGSGPAPLGVDGALYFIAEDDILGSQFWVSDGTLVGTRMVSRLAECASPSGCGPQPQMLMRIGTQVLFATSTQLWRTDGTAAGTVPFTTIPQYAGFLASSNAVAYFGTGEKFWRTDGTAAGTSSIDVDQPYFIGSILSDGRLAFVKRTTPAAEVWTTDGTPAGTVNHGSLLLGQNQTPLLGLAGNFLLLSGRSAAGTELWKASLDTAGVALLKDIDARISDVAASGDPGPGVTVGSNVFFAATDVRGRELWKSDGTTAGTQLVANVLVEAASGMVSGTVRDAVDQTPVADAEVRICTAICDLPFAKTDANGFYRFEGVIPNTYTVMAQSALHLWGQYAGGATIAVAAGFETQGVDLALSRGGTISGSVIRASTGAGLVYAEIIVRNSSGFVVDQTKLLANSIYRSKGLPSGTYYVETRNASYYTPGILDQVYGGGNCLPGAGCNWSAGQPVTVTAGSETSGISFALRDYGRIAGVVRDASTGLGLTAGVTLWKENSQSSVSAPVAADGSYLSPLVAPGTYRVTASRDGFPKTAHPNKVCTTYECNTSGATTVTVNADTTTTGVDIALTPSGTRLAGTVRSADGRLLEDIQVSLYDATGHYAGASEFTDAKGEFAINNRPPGTYYVKAQDDLYPNGECYSSQCSLTGATPIVLTTGQTVNLDVRIRDRVTTISGRITEATTNIGLSAGVFLEGNPSANIDYLSSTISSNGDYTITVLSRATSYNVYAGTVRHAYVAYPTGRMDGTVFPGTAVALTAGATHTGINIVLPRLGSIAGRVYDAQTGGAPANSILVRFKSTTDPKRDGYVWAGPNGSYLWERAEGSYYVSADHIHSQYFGQVYPDRDCTGECVPSAGNVVVVPNAGAVTGIDFHMHEKVATGRITGRVVDDLTGAGIPNVHVYATIDDYDRVYTTDANGNYETDYLHSGSYRVTAFAAPPFFSFVYGGTTCLTWQACEATAGTPVTVNAPATTTGINFRLQRLGITAVAPASGSSRGGTQITITGRNFQPQSTVLVGGRLAPIVSIAPGQIIARTPWGLAGYAHVTVTVPNNITMTLAQAFQYTPVAFTDATLTPNVTAAKSAHILELRDAINAMRSAASLPPYTFTDPTLSGVLVRNVHLLELRTALNQARAALALSTLAYTNPLAVGSPVRAIDLVELRNGVQQ